MSAISTDAIAKATRLLGKGRGLVRLSEALRLGIHRDTVRAMRDQGILELVSRGVYRFADAEPLSDPDLVLVAKRVPGAVVCLISALAFHDLTTQIPHEVHLALKRGRARPRLQYPPLKVYWWMDRALTSGVEVHERDGTQVRITSAARSVVDAFRYRNELGVDLAVEALRAWRSRRTSRPDELLSAARAVRVERVIRPYLEAVL